MKCIECSACEKGWFESKPDEYVCTGVKEPFVISDVNVECTEYPEKRTESVKHKYIRELFPDGELPFPYGEEDYAGFDSRDNFNLDWSLVAWLYERLRYFQEVVSEDIVMDESLYIFGEKVLIDGQETTQLQCINRMVEDCKIILLTDECEFDDWKDYMNIVDPAKNDLFMVLSKVYWAMWW